MFSHVFVGANDVAASQKFYDAALGALGVPAGKADPKGRVFYRTKTGMFGLTKPIDGQPACHANGGTVGFAADTPEKVKAFHDAGVAASGIPDFGDNAGAYANDGECDDPRFKGPGMTTTTLLPDDILHDARDCEVAWDNGDIELR